MAALAIAFCAAAILRLYHLGLPSMWLDELLVPMAARHPVSYIVDLCLSTEVHPPTFYFLIKALLLGGESDGFLRIFSAGFGLCAIYAAYRFMRREFGFETALVYAALLACNPLHVYVSRVVRPYAVFILAFVLSLDYLKRYVDGWRRNDLAKLLAANAVMVLLHYSSFLLLAAQTVVILLFAGKDLFRKRLKTIAAYLAVSALTVAAVMPFFIARLLRTHKEQFMGYDYGQALLNIFDKVIQTFYMFENIPLRAVMAALFLLGVFFMWRRDRTRFRFFFPLFAVPVILLCVTKYDYYAFNVWHLSFLTPVLLVFTAYGLRVLLPARRPAIVFALVLAVGGTVFLTGTRYKDFFAWDTAIVPYYTLSKPLARNLPPLLEKDAVTAFSNSGMYNGYNWYRDQFTSFNEVKEQRVTPEQATVLVQFAGGKNDFGGLAGGADDFYAKNGQPLNVRQLFQATVTDFLVTRAPVAGIGALPFEWRADMNLTGFYRQVHRLDRVMMDTDWGGSITPTQNDVTGALEYAFANSAPQGPQLITGIVGYKNTGVRNALRVLYKFDDGDFVPAGLSTGKDRREEMGFAIERTAPYERLTVRIEMNCAKYTALFPGGNLNTLGFTGMRLTAVSLKPEWLRALGEPVE